MRILLILLAVTLSLTCYSQPTVDVIKKTDSYIVTVRCPEIKLDEESFIVIKVRIISKDICLLCAKKCEKAILFDLKTKNLIVGDVDYGGRGIAYEWTFTIPVKRKKNGAFVIKGGISFPLRCAPDFDYRGLKDSRRVKFHLSRK